MDPEKEGRRLIAALGNEGFLIFLGLGGGFTVQAALEREATQQVLVIDYDINGAAELLSSREYVSVFNDPRFLLLIDPPRELLELCILELYRPALHGGIRTLPLRGRTEFDQSRFMEAGAAVKSAIDRVSADYSVQAYFGKRWFSNIIRNLAAAETANSPLPPIQRAAVTAAGPSLDEQLPLLAERRASRFLIAADTSLPSLLAAGLEPDAVVSIDCQHISYYHFIGAIPRRVPLFLDLASPPVLASRSDDIHFFSGGHPLGQYIARYWRSLPVLDTSGANVSYAALSLAENLGAREIELYGADFSYPRGQSYARGTYIYPFFEKQQTRLKPLEALFSAFLYRTPLTRLSRNDGGWYYETKALRMYRERLEDKIRSIPAAVSAVPGGGAPIHIEPRLAGNAPPRPLRLFAAGKAVQGAGEFLAGYRRDIAALPPLRTGVSRYLKQLSPGETRILTTLLPAAAAIRNRRPDAGNGELLEELRDYCLWEIDSALGTASPPQD
jgi:hypothetical protein